MIYTFDLYDKIVSDTILNFFEFCDFVDGSISGSSDKTIKNNLQLVDPIHMQSLQEYACEFIEKNQEFQYVIHPKAYTFPMFCKYEEGMHYGFHLDKYNHEGVKTDYSVTCFLNNPEEYEGGELIIEINGSKIPFKLNKGQCVVYPTGLRHTVNKVLSGVRKVMVFWVESPFQDSRIRNMFTQYSNMLLNNVSLFENNPDVYNNFEEFRYNILREHAKFS